MKQISTSIILLLLAVGCFAKSNFPSSASYEKVPLIKNRTNNPAIRLCIPVANQTNMRSVTLNFSGTSSLGDIKAVKIYSTGTKQSFSDSLLVAVSSKVSKSNTLKCSKLLSQGNNFFWISVELSPKAPLLHRIGVACTSIQLENGEVSMPKTDGLIEPFRIGLELRKNGEDNVHTYRIPGLATSNKGTLLAVYDKRNAGSGDLQGDIDVAMSRSTDGGESWEPMKVIMDMGEYGGLPQNQNGIGDPAILVDKKTGNIWVAAVWAHGSPNQPNWWASKPGMLPSETSQQMLVRSSDDGKTWSAPINITSQVKDPSWQLLLQGPGAGISLKDGTLVFAAQFKKDIGQRGLDGGQYTCHSTIMYSQDGGTTWKIGAGAKSNTTEAQPVELPDGSIMLNMRDDRNRKDKSDSNGRAVATTNDLGKTWTVHPSSNSALPEPNCMASIISVDAKVNGKMQHILFFSNPADKSNRNNMTIKVSLDGGLTWPKEHWITYNAQPSYGYSCLTQIDKHTIGLLYEGAGNLFFQKFKIEDFFR